MVRPIFLCVLDRKLHQETRAYNLLNFLCLLCIIEE